VWGGPTGVFASSLPRAAFGSTTSPDYLQTVLMS
jgi:hypothetical protein